MKALTLHQPWAALMAAGAKRVETRSWATKYRGLLAIHAAKAMPSYAKLACETVQVRRALGWPDPPASGVDQAWLDGMCTRIDALPRGAIVAVVRLVDVVPAERVHAYFDAITVDRTPQAPCEQEALFGDYSPGRFGWVCELVHVPTEPIACTGAQGLWTPPAGAIAQLEREIGAKTKC